MTEAEWLMSESAGKLVNCLCTRFGAARTKAGRRKLRLLACACCRRIWDKFRDKRDQEVVRISEEFADGLATAKQMEAARRRCIDRPADLPASSEAAPFAANVQPRQAVKWTRFYVCATVAGHGAGYSSRWNGEDAAHAGLVRELFGNPFRRPSLDKALLRWNDGTVVKVAQGIYVERAFERMPILADALLDAGCDDEAILSHCRSEGPHVRGCWVIDLILGKQ